MQSIEIEKNGMFYKAEYFSDDEMVTVFGENGEPEVVNIHGMTEVQAARTALGNLIRTGKISPK
ncbi:hypothetical protein [Lelliottia nimipressuralis]|jgi:hypothetical protein|uniref:Uncharacterized protein n=1 Tax=Lelliottia nimipressuralis TaxID=69220 RepID=A0ABY3NXA8_9ENTR|nr:hypothetical protein [Lelliottia nimipressuralis]RXJ10759.1 hypothetical protein ETG88_19695 [Lelliottia nimipressuralis]TYT29261.1 hypothetical protein FZO59_20980 [Lelliottia nimipressuralis]